MRRAAVIALALLIAAVAAPASHASAGPPSPSQAARIMKDGLNFQWTLDRLHGAPYDHVTKLTCSVAGKWLYRCKIVFDGAPVGGIRRCAIGVWKWLGPKGVSAQDLKGAAFTHLWVQGCTAADGYINVPA